jgi:aconitate hydratase
MSASLVVIHSLIGSMKLKVFDKLNPNELWPEHSEVLRYLEKIDDTLYKDIYKNIFLGNEKWQDIIVEKSESFPWNNDSSFVQVFPFKEESFKDKINIENGEILALFNNEIKTKYISSNIQITPYINVANFLQERGVKSFDFGTFEDRRGCSKLMVLGAFDTNEIKNMMVSKEGAFTKDFKTGEIISFYEKSKRAQESQKDLIIIADENYGIGETNDWAAKATKLLEVKAIIAKSFGENHRKDLIKMGILPLQFIDDDIKSLNLKGYESINIKNSEIKKDLKLDAFIYKGEQIYQIKLKLRLDNEFEIQIYKNGGLVPFILKDIV